MANVLFCSDLHFGHKNIGKFRKEFISSEQENRRIICEDWDKKVTKRDIVYVLGDACFTDETIGDFGTLPGKKILVRGNHDLLSTETYLRYFDGVFGLLKYKEFWLSHAPIHPNELRGKVNLHGHVHYDTVTKPGNMFLGRYKEIDKRYFNCCPENLWPSIGSSLVSLDEIRDYLKEK